MECFDSTARHISGGLRLLGVRVEEVDLLLTETEPSVGAVHQPVWSTTGAFALYPGDLVVFTGEMTRPRSEWEEISAGRGLIPHRAVIKKVKLVVVADPDSLSGKARKARDYDIPVVTEDGFERMLGGMPEAVR